MSDVYFDCRQNTKLMRTKQQFVVVKIVLPRAVIRAIEHHRQNRENEEQYAASETGQSFFPTGNVLKYVIWPALIQVSKIYNRRQKKEENDRYIR